MLVVAVSGFCTRRRMAVLDNRSGLPVGPLGAG